MRYAVLMAAVALGCGGNQLPQPGSTTDGAVDAESTAVDGDDAGAVSDGAVDQPDGQVADDGCATGPQAFCLYVFPSVGGGTLCSDELESAVCMNGRWKCPAGMVEPQECTCGYFTPRDCLCTPAGPACPDAGASDQSSG